MFWEVDYNKGDKIFGYEGKIRGNENEKCNKIRCKWKTPIWYS